jgi:hypothetical protein
MRGRTTHGLTDQKISVDLGGEFNSAIFSKWCTNHRIKIECVPKNSSAANGVVKRGNHAMIEGTCTQLLNAGLLHAFWAESDTAHCYICSFLPSM